VGVLARAMGLFCAIPLLLAGCSGGSNGTGGQSGRAALIGTWTKTGLNAQGRFVSCPNSITVEGVLIDSCVAGETVTFNNDGTYNIVYPAPRFINLANESGTWTLNNDSVLTMTRTTTGYDANNDGVITAPEMTDLASVSNPNAVPSNPRQRVVAQVSFSGGPTLNLLPIAQTEKDANGAFIVNSDGTVNATVTETNNIYTR
jgi:hypothetical protein